MINNSLQILNDVFGYERFHPLQKKIIDNVLDYKDTLVIMPTGAGKSLCYQLPALIFDGLTIVVSPLIALMKDQVEQLIDLNIPAVCLNSSIPREEYASNLHQVKDGTAKLLYVAPETLLKTSLLSILGEIKVDSFTIDEAHCISEWGHDFRPEYRMLKEVRERFPKSVCIALTATATRRVRHDIKGMLGFKNENEFVDSFDRKNLLLQVVEKQDPAAQTIQFISKKRDKSGIIYCHSRNTVDQLSEFLIEKNFSARPYHAGLNSETRKTNQELFIKDDIQIIVATIAFGMGINKPDIRFIVHYDLPQSIEAYYQQIGRAGRDGLKADCLLLYGYGDTLKIEYFIRQKADNEKDVAKRQLKAMTDYASTEFCRRIPLLIYFGETYGKHECGMCDNCLIPEKEKEDVTIPAQKFLSCIKRTGELFGAHYIADVLRGSKSEKVMKNNHQNLSTYNIGRELSHSQWVDLSRKLLHLGIIRQDVEYKSLKLTESGLKVLIGEQDVWATITEEKTKYLKKEDKYNTELFEILGKKRKYLADRYGIPPYVILTDKTLASISTSYPCTRAELLAIPGIGKYKLEKYGSMILQIVCNYCEANSSRVKEEEVAIQPVKRKTQMINPRYRQVGKKWVSGVKIDEIAKEYSIKHATVIDHLYKFANDGNELSSEGLVERLPNSVREKKETIFNAFQSLGTEALKPIYEEFKGSINYENLKIMRIWYLTENRS